MNDSPRISGYRVDSILAVGGMGTIWRAVQDDTARAVAIKILNVELTSAANADRLRDEARRLASLELDGVPRVLGTGQVAVRQAATPLPWFAMELVRDGIPITAYADLHELGEPDRVVLLARAARIMAAVHRRGIVHRDLKPSNILVDDSGQLHIIDFGIACEVWAEQCLVTGDPPSTEQEVAGTWGYMAPEFLDGARPDAPADVYSLGIVMRELLWAEAPCRTAAPGTLRTTGRAAHGGVPETERGTLPARVSRRSRSTRFTGSRPLRLIADKACAADPGHRYADASLLAEDLARVEQGRPIRARRRSTLARGVVVARHHRAAVAVMLLTVLVTLGAGFSALNERPNRSVKPGFLTALAYDPMADAVVAFGAGYSTRTGSTRAGTMARLDDWSWEPALPGDMPSILLRHGSAFAMSDDGRFLVHGGNNEISNKDEMTLYDPAAKPGSKRRTYSEPEVGPLDRSSLIHAPGHDYFIMHGGRDRGYDRGSRGPGRNAVPWQARGDTWIIRLLDPAGATGASDPPFTVERLEGEGPSPRFSSTVAYDSDHDRILLFGGWVSETSSDTPVRVHRDLWALDCRTPRWTLLATAPDAPGAAPLADRPWPELGGSGVYDTHRSAFALYVDDGSTWIWRAHVDADEVDAGHWALLLPSEAGPGAWRETRAVYDPVERRMMLASGVMFIDAATGKRRMHWQPLNAGDQPRVNKGFWILAHDREQWESIELD